MIDAKIYIGLNPSFTHSLLRSTQIYRIDHPFDLCVLAYVLSCSTALHWALYCRPWPSFPAHPLLYLIGGVVIGAGF